MFLNDLLLYLSLEYSLTHCDLETQYGDTDLDRHGLRWWLAAWQHQAITRTNVQLLWVRFCGIHLKAISQWLPELLFSKTNKKITLLKLLSCLPVAKELKLFWELQNFNYPKRSSSSILTKFWNLYIQVSWRWINIFFSTELPERTKLCHPTDLISFLQHVRKKSCSMIHHSTELVSVSGREKSVCTSVLSVMVWITPHSSRNDRRLVGRLPMGFQFTKGLACKNQIDGFVQDYSVLAVEILQSCTKPSKWGHFK